MSGINRESPGLAALADQIPSIQVVPVEVHEPPVDSTGTIQSNQSADTIPLGETDEHLQLVELQPHHDSTNLQQTDNPSDYLNPHDSTITQPSLPHSSSSSEIDHLSCTGSDMEFVHKTAIDSGPLTLEAITALLRNFQDPILRSAEETKINLSSQIQQFREDCHVNLDKKFKKLSSDIQNTFNPYVEVIDTSGIVMDELLPSNVVEVSDNCTMKDSELTDKELATPITLSEKVSESKIQLVSADNILTADHNFVITQEVVPPPITTSLANLQSVIPIESVSGLQSTVTLCMAPDMRKNNTTNIFAGSSKPSVATVIFKLRKPTPVMKFAHHIYNMMFPFEKINPLLPHHNSRKCTNGEKPFFQVEGLLFSTILEDRNEFFSDDLMKKVILKHSPFSLGRCNAVIQSTKHTKKKLLRIVEEGVNAKKKPFPFVVHCTTPKHRKKQKKKRVRSKATSVHVKKKLLISPPLGKGQLTLFYEGSNVLRFKCSYFSFGKGETTYLYATFHSKLPLCKFFRIQQVFSSSVTIQKAYFRLVLCDACLLTKVKSALYVANRIKHLAGEDGLDGSMKAISAWMKVENMEVELQHRRVDDFLSEEVETVTVEMVHVYENVSN